MSVVLAADEELVRSLPLPLAQLYRRAHDAKTPLERHMMSYYLWQASLELLGSVAIVAYAERSEHDRALTERLTSLARPAVGHWWEYVRLLVPALADGGEEPFGEIRDLVREFAEQFTANRRAWMRRCENAWGDRRRA